MGGGKTRERDVARFEREEGGMRKRGAQAWDREDEGSSMPGALDITVALDSTDRVGDTEVGGRCVISVEA